MTAENPRSPFNLPDLASTNFELLSADLTIVGGFQELTVPRLILEGEEDAFEQTFSSRGQLRVRENGTSPGGVAIGRSFNSVVVGSGRMSGIIISGVSGSVSINNRSVNVGSNTVGSGPRKASLFLPAEHSVSHDIGTASGDVYAERIVADVMKVTSASGDIALRSSKVVAMRLGAASGDIDVDDTQFTEIVTIRTIGGDINVSDSQAPGWIISTISGDIRAKNTQGKIDGSSMSGRLRIR